MDTLSQMAACELAFNALISQLTYFTQKPNPLSQLGRTPFSKVETFIPFIDEARHLVAGTNSPQLNQQSHLSTLFEQIKVNDKPVGSAHFYPLQAVNAATIFPSPEKITNDHLWQDFISALAKIPSAHRENPALWLDHFDTALQVFMGNVPSQYAADISLYDESKATAALATALYLYDSDPSTLTNKTDEKFLLIQGDFFGIQDFIFSGGSDTNKKAAKLLRGRSFQVSLFTELAALKVLEACELPSTSQIMNAAGKFLIVAPNTQAVKKAIENTKAELNQWFVKNTYGLIGLGIATKSASQTDFLAENFRALRDSLFSELEQIKLQRLDLLETTVSVQDERYPHGVCRLNHYFPALSDYEKDKENSGLSALSLDQIKIGQNLATRKRIIISQDKGGIYANEQTHTLQMMIFGYRVFFTENEQESGKFGLPIQEILRFWDFELPSKTNESIWHGYARRYINGYVPYFNTGEVFDPNQYKAVAEENKPVPNTVKTFDYLACVNRQPNNAQFVGQTALMTLKGDVDNLGTIFQKGFEQPNLAKMAALSRQMNQFFSLWLPAVCAENFPNIYTVFAGGDDFFLIGPWLETQKLAYEMQQQFARYVAKNQGIHFSAGMVMTKLGIPVPQLGELAEEALEQAKSVDGKNAVTIYQQPVSWNKWNSLTEAENEIARLAKDYHISASYLYSLIHFSEEAEKEQNGNIESSMWRSRFYYKTARYVVDKLPKEKHQNALDEISRALGEGIAQHKNAFKIPLFNYVYQIRK
ncbi:TPA: type III-A CRISPR-associated protein Cas10/Csm1 [Mannheimia haemolytica]